MRCVGVCEPPPSDAGPPCAPPWFNAPAGGTSPLVWHFDASPVVDMAQKCPPAPAIEIGPGMGACGSDAIEKAYDGGGSKAQLLGCTSSDNPSNGASFHVAFWFRVPVKPNALLVQKIDPQGSGWALDMSVVGVLQFVGRSISVPSVQIAIGPELVPGTWHAIYCKEEGRGPDCRHPDVGLGGKNACFHDGWRDCRAQCSGRHPHRSAGRRGGRRAVDLPVNA